VGVERHLVNGGGTVVLALKQADQLTVCDREGLQICELIVFGMDGSCDGHALNVTATGDASGLKAILGRGGVASERLASSLRRHGARLSELRSIDVFGEGSRAGDEISFDVTADSICVVAAPGGPMGVDEQNPPTDIEVFVHRAAPQSNLAAELPAPLAEARLDFRIDRATAQSYLVKAGEYVQVLDIEGRQCSDFQAFPLAQLDRGIERCLDMTTTRTLMGASYPGPGLFAKYYDQDMRPLVEIVQDTCGRHDAFGLACSAKYYDDVGYPGHVNCSDNFNTALASTPVAPRRGWMAMNFFFNSGIDEQNQLYLEDPWSRPGDFVLMKALTDLVCVSSSCPDDISPANAWTPTEIQVRVYTPEKVFSRSIGFRMTTDADVQTTKETGFHERTSALTRDFVEYKGFWLPNSYPSAGPIAEYWACREKAIVMDLTALRKFEVVGPDAETLLQNTMTRNVRKLAAGQVVYSAMCYDNGGMVDDGTLFRLGADNFRWIGGDDFSGIWLREQAERSGLQVWVKSATDQLHNIAVQGPLSRGILTEIVWTPPTQPTMEELQWFRFAIGRIGDFDGIPVVISRTGFTGELGYEVWCHPKDAVAVWDAVWNAGEPRGLSPLGFEALDILRIESGLIMAGQEFDDQTDPFEAGIGFTVALKSKEDDFIGKEALVRRKENPQRKLVGLELAGNEPAAHGNCVRIGRQQVGVVTSGTRSPILGKNIALCRMSVEHAEVGTEVEVGKLDGHQKRLPATVVPFPFYDPEKKRPRS
jgi:aminomethyltransferase